jgi:hypothetical protein
MACNHGFGQGLTVEARTHDLEVPDQSPQIAVVGGRKGIDGCVLELNAFFPKDTPSNSSEGFFTGSNEIDLDQMLAESVPR